MKKILIIILIILIFFTSIFCFKKRNKNNEKIVLAEVTHSIFYTPLYVAIENKYFEKYGLDLELILTSGADKVSAAVLSGDAQIGLAGAESAIYIYNAGEKDYLKIFSGLTKRDGQFIIGRKKTDNFSFDDLKNKEILVGRRGGMPSLNFLNAIENRGLNISDFKINYSIDFASLSGAFISGEGDYVNLFEPNATSLVKNKNGYILTSVGKYSGEMPYTVFYSKKSYIKNNAETINNFRKAINDGLIYTKNHSSKEIANLIAKQFPDTSINDLELMIQNYKDADSWLEDTTTSEKSFKNLEDLLIKNKLIDSYVPYNKLVINNEK